MKLSPIKTFIYYFLQFSWGIIQNVIGLLLWLITKDANRKSYIYYGDIVTKWDNKSSLSLGIFIFLGSDDERILKHEYGHSIQSLILGPFYLLVIGIPSLIWNVCFNTYRVKRNRNYYKFYTERWADILGKNNNGGNLL